MDKFLEFIKDNYQTIIVGFSALVSILTLLLKRKPKTLDDFLLYLDEVFTQLPKFINDVEVPGNGEQKKDKVIKLALKFVKARLGRDMTEKELKVFYKQVDKQIEAILETPTKKGD